MKNCCSN